MRSYVVDDSGSVVKLIIPAGEPDAGTYLPVYNGHGDTLSLSRLETDGTLTLANSYRYETWGRPTTTTHNSIGDLGFRFTYVGEFDVQWDDQLGLGLIYMHARHYAPALGRFLQPDPELSDPNLYAYAANNPVTDRHDRSADHDPARRRLAPAGRGREKPRYHGTMVPHRASGVLS